MCAWRDLVDVRQASILSVRSVNRPCDVQLGMNTTSAENRSGSAVRAGRRADLGLVVVRRDDRQLDLVLVRWRCRRRRAPGARLGRGARPHRQLGAVVDALVGRRGGSARGGGWRGCRSGAGRRRRTVAARGGDQQCHHRERRDPNEVAHRVLSSTWIQLASGVSDDGSGSIAQPGATGTVPQQSRACNRMRYFDF